MKVTEKELVKLIKESIEKHILKEYGDNWNYPAGADYPGAPWYDNDPDPEYDENYEEHPTLPVILYCLDCLDYSEDEQRRILNELKNIAIPEKIQLWVEFSYITRWERDEDGGCSYRDDEEPESYGARFNIGGKKIEFEDWIKQNVNDERLADILLKANKELMDIVEDCKYDIMREDYGAFDDNDLERWMKNLYQG